jgi:long-chain acyl-CoA synthetase
VHEFSVPPVAAISDSTNLADPVWDNGELHAQTVQFARRDAGGRWHEVTCGEFRDEVREVARGLIAAGIGVGDRVALMSRTRYEWTLLDYAIWSVGAVSVPIYETSSPEQVQWILSDSGAAALVLETDAHRDAVAGRRDELPALRHVWQLDGPTPAIGELVAAATVVPAAEVETRRHAARADDLATIIYTSGTTGRPKGCMLSHRNMYADVANASPGLADLFEPGASTLLFLPLAHAFARLIQLGIVYHRILLAHAPDARNLLDDMQDFKPTFILSVPRVFEKLYNGARQQAFADGRGAVFEAAERTAIAYSRELDSPGGPGMLLTLRHRVFDRLVYRKLRAALGGRCRTATSGGAPLGERLAHFLRGAGLTVYEGYGLTETSPACTVNQIGHIRIGTVGRPVPGTTLRIADDHEILVSGDIVFQGYWNNEAATRESKDADGWLHTGDLGDLDDDGYLTIIGRKKEVLVTASGKNVAPAVLEDPIRAHHLVSHVLVIGDQRPFIAALITLDADALPAWKRSHDKPESMSPAELADDPDLRAELQKAIDSANSRVSQAESIRVFRILTGDFTEANGMLTPSLKVKRTVVMKEYADEIAAIYR